MFVITSLEALLEPTIATDVSITYIASGLFEQTNRSAPITYCMRGAIKVSYLSAQSLLYLSI